MKKVLLLIAVVAVLSGCGTNDKLTCTYDNTVGDVTSKTEYVIEYRNNNIKKIKLNLWRKILLIFCTISFFELLILLPDLFLVSKFGIVSIVFILLLAFVDTYIIDFLSELFDKIIIKIKEVKNEKRKKENKLF